MNNFEIFKLKRCGLNNRHIRHIIDYETTHGKSLSARDRAVVSQYHKPAVFLEHYKNLDIQACKANFQRFPSFSILDTVYPLALKEIYDAPTLLFYQGDLTFLDAPKLGVVGARTASNYGSQAVNKIISDLQNRFVIVSGLARGIDTAAHMAALKNGGKSIAVIGTGLDVHYPKANAELQNYMAKHHLVLTEYGPREQPLKFHFPARNRIIAGLSQGILVAEAKRRSGSLITCERALEEGREVFALPGSILDGQSDGCHQLIQEGAKCVTSAADILIELQLPPYP